MNAKPGDIWLADLGLAAKTRPILIVSRFDPDAPRALLTYVPLTTQHRGSRYEVQLGDLPFLHQASVVNIQGIGSLIEPRLERKLGQLSAATIAKVKDALRQRNRFVPLRVILEEISSSIDSRYLKSRIGNDSATIELGRPKVLLGQSIYSMLENRAKLPSAI